MPAHVPLASRRLAILTALTLVGAASVPGEAATPARVPRLALGGATQGDSNQAFLRRLADHHRGTIAIVDAAMPRITDTPKKDARPLREAASAEQREIVALLRATGDTLPPRLRDADRAMADAVRRSTFGGVAAREFYRQAVAHLQAGVELIDRMLPQLSGDTKALAERVRGAHAGQIADLKRRGGV